LKNWANFTLPSKRASIAVLSRFLAISRKTSSRSSTLRPLISFTKCIATSSPFPEAARPCGDTTELGIASPGFKTLLGTHVLGVPNSPCRVLNPFVAENKSSGSAGSAGADISRNSAAEAGVSYLTWRFLGR